MGLYWILQYLLRCGEIVTSQVFLYGRSDCWVGKGLEEQVANQRGR
jgi:hypothetical protein